MIEVELQKGDGAQYAKSMKKLSNAAFYILKWWVNYPNKWLSSHEAYKMFAQDIRASKDFPPSLQSYKLRSFIARVSEFVALRILSMTTDIRKMLDQETMSIRHPHKPMYCLADKSLAEEIIRRNGYVFWVSKPELDMRNQLISEVKPKFW
jgi:hypothetical protein